MSSSFTSNGNTSDNHDPSGSDRSNDAPDNAQGNTRENTQGNTQGNDQENDRVTAAGHWIPDYSPNPFRGDSESRWTGEVTWVVPTVPDLDRPAPIRVKVDTGQIRRRLSRIDGAEIRGEVWADYWLDVLEAVAEIPALLDAVEQLVSAWKGERRRYADLLAAAKATLSADRDGENDPLAYLRDEIDHGYGAVPRDENGGRR